MAKIRAFVRIFILIVSLFFIVPWFTILHFLLGADLHRSIRHRMRYAQFILKVLGVRVSMTGTPPSEPVLFVANHRSWLDPVLTYHAPMLVVAKAEVQKWPMIGFGCELSGAIYVQRDKKTSRKKTLEEILSYWKKGFSVLIYSEGTTNAARTTKEFRLGGFRLAAEHGMPVAPIAIEYRRSSDYWVGGLFLPHVMATFGKKRTFVKVHYGDVLRSDDADALAQMTKKVIDDKLTEMQKNWLIDDRTD